MVFGLFFLGPLPQPPFVLCPPLLCSGIQEAGPERLSSHVCCLLDSSWVVVGARSGGLDHAGIFSPSSGEPRSGCPQGWRLLGLSCWPADAASFSLRLPSSYKDTSSAALGPTLIPTFTLVTSFGPISRYSHILSYWGVRLQHMHVLGGGHRSARSRSRWEPWAGD